MITLYELLLLCRMPAVVDGHRDPRVGIRTIGQLDTEFVERRIDFDCVDMPGPLARATATSFPFPPRQ